MKPASKADVRERQEGDRLLAIALDVHATVTGAVERPLQDQAADVQLLRDALATWTPSFWKKAEAFDQAVKGVLEAALVEHETAWYQPLEGGGHARR